MLDFSPRFILFFALLYQWKIRHYVLAHLPCWFGAHLVTHCVSYFTNIILGLFQNLTSEKIRHTVLAKLLCWFGIHLVIEERLKQTHCVRYFTKIHLIFSLFYQCINHTLCFIYVTVLIVVTFVHWKLI